MENTYKYKKDFLLVMVASFCFMACPMMTTPLITGFAKTMGAGGAIMGLAGGLMNVCSMICRPFAGNLADLQSKYRLAFIGGIIMLLACTMYATSSNIYVILIARIIHGLGFSLCSVTMSTWIACMLPPEKIGSGMGIYGTINAVSMGIAPLIGIKISEYFGYRASFLVAAGFVTVLIVIIQFTTYRGEVRYTANERAKRRSDFHLVESRVVPIGIIITLFAIPYFATQTFIVGYVADRKIAVAVGLFFPIYAVAVFTLRIALRKYFDRLPFKYFVMACAASALDRKIAVAVGLFFPIYAVAVFTLRIALRKYFDRLPFKYFVMACAASALVGMISLWLLNGNLLMFAAAIFTAGGYGLMCSVAQSNAFIMVEREKRGLANSTYYLGLDMGMALGPMIGGLIYGHIPISQFYLVLMITAPLAVLVYFVNQKKFNQVRRRY